MPALGRRRTDGPPPPKGNGPPRCTCQAAVSRAASRVLVVPPGGDVPAWQAEPAALRPATDAEIEAAL